MRGGNLVVCYAVLCKFGTGVSIKGGEGGLQRQLKAPLIKIVHLLVVYVYYIYITLILVVLV